MAAEEDAKRAEAADNRPAWMKVIRRGRPRFQLVMFSPVRALVSCFDRLLPWHWQAAADRLSNEEATGRERKPKARSKLGSLVMRDTGRARSGAPCEESGDRVRTPDAGCSATSHSGRGGPTAEAEGLVPPPLEVGPRLAGSRPAPDLGGASPFRLGRAKAAAGEAAVSLTYTASPNTYVLATLDAAAPTPGNPCAEPLGGSWARQEHRLEAFAESLRAERRRPVEAAHAPSTCAGPSLAPAAAASPAATPPRAAALPSLERLETEAEATERRRRFDGLVGAATARMRASAQRAAKGRDRAADALGARADQGAADASAVFLTGVSAAAGGSGGGGGGDSSSCSSGDEGEGSIGGGCVSFAHAGNRARIALGRSALAIASRGAEQFPPGEGALGGISAEVAALRRTFFADLDRLKCQVLNYSPSFCATVFLPKNTSQRACVFIFCLLLSRQVSEAKASHRLVLESQRSGAALTSH